MPAVIKKGLIALGTALLVVIVYLFFDPTLRDLLYAMILRLYLLVVGIVVKFAFKKGAISLATIAWKRIILVGGAALFKRFWINFTKKNLITHVIMPLKPALKRWMKEHVEDFKEQPMWMKTSETTIGTILVGLVAYFVGFLTYLMKIIQAVMAGQFQTFILSVMGMIANTFNWIWSLIKPWFDVLFITALLEFISRLSLVRRTIHKTQRVHEKVVNKKNEAIQAVVHAPIKKVSKIINNHADKKMRHRKKKCDDVLET